MSGSEQTDDAQKSVEDLTKLLAELQTKYSNLEAAHTTTKEDLRVAKASTADVTKLQKELDKSIAEKSALISKVDESKNALVAYKGEVSKEKVKSHMSTALDAAGARNSATAMKLIDMGTEGLVDTNGEVVITKIADAINALKVSDPVLFKDEGGGDPNVSSTSTMNGRPTSPAVKHAADRITKSGMETEMSAAKTQEEIMAVMEKYNTV